MRTNIKIKIQVLITGTLILFGTSCSDFLEEVDPSNITSAGYFRTTEHAEAALNSVYDGLRSGLGGAYGGGPWLMVEFAAGITDSDLGQADNSNIIRNLDNNADNGYGSAHWTNKYKAIGNANLCIAYIPEVEGDEALKNKYLAEAKFLRAYNYFELVRMFGKVPLIDQIVNLESDLFLPVRAEVADVYALIVKDLTEAEATFDAQGLPFNDASGRVSRGAIKTMLASVYLTMAGYPLEKGASHYTLAAAKAKEVIDNGSYKLFDSYDDLHDPAMKNKEENIFMVQYAAGVTSSNWQPHIIPYNLNISSYSAQTGAIYANQEFINAHAAGDKRVEEKAFYYTEFTSKTDRSVTVPLGGYFLYKHFDVAANLGDSQSDLNWSIHRYAELLLIYAEASNESGTATALAYKGLNDIRARAGLAPHVGLTQDQFREAVWKEKWFELSYENKTWYDMTRIRKGLDVTTGKFVDYVGYHPVYLPVGTTMTARELLFPIPTADIQNNKNLVQNDGY
jgi:starch-binding outer membrane protein, SusD/RagB family